MPSLQTRTHDLPIIRYSSGVSLPGASHRVGPARPRVKVSGRVLSGVALLCLSAAAAARLHSVRPVAVAVPQTRPVEHWTSLRMPAPRKTTWAMHLSAQPPKGRFVRFFRMRATAYAPINTRMEGGRYTYTERDGRAVHGVAVDPDIIPLGSRLWIPRLRPCGRRRHRRAHSRASCRSACAGTRSSEPLGNAPGARVCAARAEIITDVTHGPIAGP